MSTVDTARAAVEKATKALQAAEVKAAAALEGVRSRNAKRHQDFWADAAERCGAAYTAASGARARVVDLAAAGDLPAALSAYADYVRAVAEAHVVIHHAANETAEYVWTEQRNLGGPGWDGVGAGYEQVERRVRVVDWARDHDAPPEAQHHIERPDGMHTAAPLRVSLVELLAEGMDRLEVDHRADYTAALLGPLNASLESED